MVRARFLSFAAVLGTGFLLSVSLVLSAAVAAFGRYGWGWLPAIGPMLELADFLGSMLVHTLLFAMIFKLLPDAAIRWREVWLGAGVTAGLFFVGKLVIGLYLGSSEIGAAYGAAGWVILILAWVYYSAQIVLFGAEFTRAYAIGWPSLLIPLSPQGRGQGEGWSRRGGRYISTIPSPTFWSRSSTSGSCPGSTRSSDDASERILSNAEYMRGRSWRVLNGMRSSKLR